eukprot:scaffold7181_cov128-Skeletonema_marinoi.AAC.1
MVLPCWTKPVRNGLIRLHSTPTDAMVMMVRWLQDGFWVTRQTASPKSEVKRLRCPDLASCHYLSLACPALHYHY